MGCLLWSEMQTSCYSVLYFYTAFSYQKLDYLDGTLLV